MPTQAYPIIRPETPGDSEAIESVTVAAFREAPHSSHTEQHIVRALRAAGACGTQPLHTYSMHIDIEWNPDKAESNLAKHGVSFDEAATSLLDPMALAREDEDAEGEARWVLMGMSAQARLLIVVYTLRRDERIRLISARKATPKEAGYYA